MKAKSLYIQKLAYDENTGNEIIGLFPSEANPAIVSSYTYDAKRMGGAPTLTATIYSSEPLQWKKEEFVEYNGDRFFASYTPNSTKDNSSRMWKSEITFTSRRELLDNTLFFDVVVDDVDTQNKDRYRSNQTKFTFGGTIHEFVARINSSMAYCGLYRPTDEHKGYYVVIDEGYGTDEVKEVSFEDQYLTDVLQLINTTFELDYYWDGNVCHVGKVQHDLTDTPIKYGSSDALISVSKENANYKIVDMITGYGSSDNLPYYYPNDDEFGEAVFNTENISKDKVSVELSKFLKDSRYNDNLILYKSKEGKSYNGSVDVSSHTFDRFTTPSNLTQADNQSNPTVTCRFSFSIPISAIKGQSVDLTNLNFISELNSSVSRKDYITNVGNAVKSIYIFKGKELYKTISNKTSFGSVATYTFEEDGDFTLSIKSEFSYKCKVYKNSAGINDFYGADSWNAAFSGSIEFLYESKSEYEWKNGDKYIPYGDAGINVSEIGEANCIEYDYQFVKDGDRYGFNKVYTGTEDNAVKVIVTDRVWIAPSSVLMPSIYRNTKGAERFYYALNNTHKLPSGNGYYEFVNLYKKGNPHQGTVTFDGIKPTIKGIVNAEGQLFGEIADVAFDKEDSDVKDSDGKHIHNYFYIKLHKFNGDFGFDLFAHALASESAKINLIKSNGCPACSFVIGCYWDSANNKCYNNVLTDGNGNLKSDSGKMNSKGDYILNDTYVEDNKSNQDSTKEELWICIQKDTSTLGIVMPNASAGFKPQKGDLFVITGIKPPKVLVTAAEKRLDDALVKHMSENNTDQFNYSVKFSRIFLQENPDFASKLNENAKLSIQIQGDSNSDGSLIGHEVFVSNYSVKVDNDELAEVEIELVNSLEVTKSDTKQIIDAVKGEAVKSLSSMVGGSNTNSFNASITDKMYLSKLNDDTAKGTITWEKIQKLLSGLLVGNSNSENGGSWTPDTEGRSHLITDYLEVRMKAIFEELVVKKTSTIGGKEIISPAGGVVAHKVEDVTVTYNNVSQKAYRCYFLAEQEGDAVDNDFAIGDQVRSESFNVRKGTYHKVGNHFYWRLVIGRDEEPVELEGKKYHYIDLSDTDCATASDVPAKGDVLNQCGNRTDVDRQNCLIFSAVDTYSPSVSLYHGINSYSFANKEYVEYGVNKQTNKAFFNVYGDMYVGDRPTKENGYEGSSYIKYDSAAKQVSVKGKISAKSTVDGKELSQYIKENSAKGLTEEQVNNLIKNSQVITDLQNQVDGAIETWFYEGVPTLKNAPASSWTTDKDKDTHLGDLYYDNKTGKAYRFAKDGSTYKWTIITDTDISKALSDASKAQETADGKMKVFSTQPNPPYQVGDIWVNATYPSDGSTYKNEVLRCQTNKAAGSQFAIADWIKASKYTDDTVANAAKAAAEKAQKAAETAQTNVTNLGKTVTSNKKAFDSYVTDGYLEPSEIAAMAQDSKRLEDAFAAAEKSYTEVKGAEVLKSTKELTDLNTAFATLTTAKKELIEYLSDISSRYNAADTNGKATIVSAVGPKFTNFQSAYSAFYDKLGLANAYITSKIYSDLGVVIGDVTSLAYLKKALMDAPDTEINGGLVLTSLIGLRDIDGNTTAGINGITEKSAKGGGIAAWFGGEMVDKDYNDGSKTPANTIFRFDGSGYVAGGAIWWGTDGRVHADPTSFIISEKNLGAYLTFFEPTWKAGSAGTSVADLVSLKPNAPFTKLGVSGDASFEGAITFHGIKLTYDATNKAIKVDGNLYATGGITAYGASSVAGGGGGLNGSVKAYADATRLTTENLSEIASAYSVAKLYSEIQNVASAVPSISVSVPTGGNALTGATYNASTGVITFTKGTFLTAHQSLDGYVNEIATSGTGNAITSVSKSGKKLTFTKGATFLTSHQSLSAYLKSADAANTYLKLSGGAMTGNIRYKGSKGTSDMITFVDNNANLYGNGISIGGGGLTIIGGGESANVLLKQHTNGGDENMIVANDAAIDFFSNVQYGWDSRKAGSFDTSGYWNGAGFKKDNSSDSYVLLGGGGHKAISSLSVNYANSAGSANSVAWSNVSGRPTKVSQFTNDSGYITSSASITGNAATATKLQTERKLWGNSFNGLGDINGSIIVPSGKYISIGNIKLEYDATNKALKITNTTTDEVANLYTSGGVSAYGVGTSSSSGGGLNGSVKAYADATRLTTENLSEIASAYSVAKLYSEIQNVASAVPSISVSVPTGGNALTGATYDASTGVITFTKGTFLTAHQSLASYYTKAEIDAKGYTTNKGTVTSVGLTLPTGLVCATKTITTSGTFAISLASGYSIPTTTKQTAWDGAVSAKHTHSNKSVLDGISSTKVSHWDSAYGWYALMTTDEETADGIINKWNEVVSFLSNIAQTDTLSGIVDGINKSISDEVTRAKKAEGVNASGISTNKTNITTLQGYFTSGSAKKALQLTNARKLWGNSFNGTADINGSIIVPDGKYISIGNIKMEYDATNKALKITNTTTNEVANLYTSGGVSAYGVGTSSSSGGGLNGSVKAYADAIKLTTENLSEIASAYSVAKLYSEIQNVASAVPSISVSVPTGGNALTGATYDASTGVITFTKGTFLTAHQSLASYYTKAEIDAKGYTTNKGTVTSVGLTLPTGLVCATKTITTSGTFAISLASGYSIPTTTKQTAWDGAVSAKHTHSNKSVLDGISSTKVSHWDSAYGWYALMTTDEETADGIINKWNEVVSFLANIAQTDTLSGIVDGINKSISDEVTRAKKAEGLNALGISTNKTSITTLQGYFTSGSAKKALQLTNARKLWGNSFNGTADINGSIIVPDGKYISIGNIKLEYDATNKALKITNTTTNEVANLYTSGGVSAYGVGTSSSSGGGLNGSVKAYADATRLTTENLSEIASAYSVAKLYSEIQNVASAVPSISVSVPTGGNALTGATYDASTGVITFTKGTFLTAHQSLDGYVNAIAVSGSGNAVTAVTKSGKTITFTKGATYLTSHQSLSNYYTKSSVDSLLNGKSATTHTHSVKINGITKTIAASGGDAVDLGTYLTTHQSLAAYATQNWVKNEATAHNADMVDNYHASGLFTGFSISDVANKVTISIGGTSKALNLVRAFPSGVGNNFNDIATHGNSMGMSHIAAPYASSTANYQTLNGYVNPNGQTGWHHYINLSYTDSNNTATSPNMWQTQFAIKAGTTEVYVRSRAGGKISNSDAWAAPWVRLARVTDNVASASKVANALSWSGYSSGSYNGSAAKSISIPDNTNQLTNGAGFITASASISGNAGSATKLQNSRTINGTSFNGTANIVTSYWGTTRKLWGNSVNGNADVNGSITIANTDGVYVQIGDVRLVYDKANTAIKVVKSDGTTAANFYATGGITAYGEGSGSSGGGGLNGSVKSYADALKLASESLSEIASAYSIKALDSRISSLEGGSATAISVSGTGNAITSVTKSGKTVTFTKGTTFLTSHQSLSAYLKSADAANTYSKLGHTHSQYLTSHQSLAGYATQSWVTNKGYITSSGSITGNAATATNADKVDGYHASSLFRDLGWWGSSETHNANDIEGNGSVFAYSTHSNVPTTGVLTTFSGGNDAYNWQMIKTYTSRGLYVRYRNGDNSTWSDWIRLLDENDLTWSSISNRPTKVSQFSNDSNYATQSWVNNKGYITSSGSISGNAATATNADKVDGVHVTWSGSLTSTSHLVAWEADGSALRDISPSSIKLSQFTDDILSGKYLSLNGGAMKANSRISANGGNLYLGNADDKGFLYLQDAASQSGATYWLIKSNGTARFKQIYIAAKDKNFNEDANVIECFDATLCLNWYSSRDINMCNGGGIVKIGTGITDGKLNVGGNILATGGITAYSSSDIRLKQDLRKLDYFGIIKAMGGTFGFAWKKDNTRSIGWIAQHVLCNPHLKDIVETDENGYYKINYWSPKLIATAFGAIEQVGDEVSRLKARVVFLESEVQRLSGKQDGNNKKRLDNKNINLLN